MKTITKELVCAAFPSRKADGNKGDFGRALLICGSYSMPGAACMSAQAAARSGTGLVELAFPGSAYPAVAPRLIEPVLLPSPEREGRFCMESTGMLLSAAEKADAVLIGCGIGQSEETEKAVCRLIREVEKPLVIDADGINILSRHIDLLERRSVPTVLTPHPGEMGRLMGTSAVQVQSDRERAAEYFSRLPLVTLVLKGAGTIVSAQGKHYCNPTGNSGMAKGGSGDVLAGILVSFLAQGIEPVPAASAAVFIHGLCGDRCAGRTSARGMLPSDMIAALPEVLGEFEPS